MTCLKVPKNNEPAISATNKTLADILGEMRNRADTVINGRAITERNFVPQETVEDWADRIEAAVRYQFRNIQSLCQAEINSSLSDHISAIFMLKVVRDAAQDQLSKLSPMEGRRITMADQNNAAATRGALTDVLLALDEAGFKPGDSADPLTVAVLKAGQVLVTPVRNCDIGTLTEQQQRFHNFCEKMQHTNKACCGGCPIVHLRMQGIINNSCELAWAQMPYEEEEENANESKP